MQMGEMVVSAVVNVLIEKLISGPLMNLTRYENIDSQLKKWKTSLTLIQDVLVDAGQKHITQKAVESWLNDLRDLAYDMEDVLDDMATEAMKRELNQESDTSTSTLREFIKSADDGFTHFVYERNISLKLDDITTRLNDLLVLKTNLGLDVNVKFERSNYSNRRLETSLVEESKVLGREGDKAALLEKLLGDKAGDQDVSIVSIVGLGGIGKTTLARVLYNDEKVKDHFELRAWVCVSDEFDVSSISKVIYQAVTGENAAFANLDLLHVALKEKLSKKRFLIVLDDVWNEDHEKWEILERPLVGVPGSKIIVTTRKIKVTSVMNSVQPHILKVLSDEHALSLLGKYALKEGNFDKHLSLIPIARGIIEKCDGLPLALIALGRVLKSKESEEDEWEQLLKSEIWSSYDGRDILPALKLSYFDLPSQLKQVFAYCCFFPKDYLFNKNELVLLWMAEGFLYQPTGNVSMECLGCQYFEELRSRSFFQQSTDKESEYTMHDLMNDLAISVAGEFFFMLDEKIDLNGKNEAFEKFRHFSFIHQLHVTYRKFTELHRATRLRTFLSVSFRVPNCLIGYYTFTFDNVLIEVLRQLQFLRVLDLSRWETTEVPPFIGSLKHLRYLNFSYTRIKQVPEQVSELYNLQSLLVRNCNELSRLPVSFAKLINLRHLDMSNTRNLKETPLGIDGLTSLHTLTKVFIKRGNGFKISDLKGLLNLQGKLSIKGLEKVTDPQQAKDANLEGNKGLVRLDMKWSDVFDCSRNLRTEYEVLKWLKPHRKLKTLRISCYGGVKFPSWLGDPSFDKLTNLTLKGCRNLKEVNVGSSNMKYVSLYECDSLESYNCPNSVEGLGILECSSMTSLTLSTTLQELPSSLKDLHISNCSNLNSFPHERLQSLTSLKEMVIIKCESMDELFPCGLWPPNLRRLKIGRLKKPMSEWGLQNYPTSLVHLELNGLNSGVTSFAMEEDASNTDSTSFLLPPSLTFLRIKHFKDVESISKVLQHLTHLQELHIVRCMNIRAVPRKTSLIVFAPGMR